MRTIEKVTINTKVTFAEEVMLIFDSRDDILKT